MIGYGYDPLNRVTLKLMPAPHDSVRYAYDLRGLQTGAAFASTGWGVSNAYDGFGRLISTASNMGGFSRTVSHKYDSDGRESEIAFPDNQKFWTARDGLGRATEMYQAPLGSTSTIMVAFAYNAASQLSYFARRFGDWTAYGYDGAGRLSSLEDGFGAGLGNTRSDFLYNPASQLSSETRTNDSYAWRGSAAVSRDYGTNGQNQYSGTSSGATFGYDANGNLISAVNAPWSTTYVYDPENRLISASGTENASLVYDPLGRLFQISSPTAATTQFLYDGDELVAEYNGSGTLLRRYVHGDSDDDPLFWYEGAGFDQPRFPHVNHQGSITGTAGPGAILLGVNTYDEYGIPGAGNAGRFQYTGQAWLTELGMYYYKARFYSPTLGRFMQADPIGYDDQINLYAYVGNDPVNLRDPAGTFRCTGFVGCAIALRDTVGQNATSATRWFKTKLGLGVGAAAASAGIIANETRRSVKIPVFRVFDEEKASRNGSSWSLEDPRTMSNWRDRLAVYPEWNKGTKVVQGWITMQDMHMKNVLPGPGPNSTAGPQPRDPNLGGGPYQGKGNEIIIPNASKTVKEQIVYPMCSVTQSLRSC